MSSDSLSPTQVILSGCATLENMRPVPKKSLTFMYDAIFTCADHDREEGVGCLRHYVGRDSSQKEDGLYDFAAKVRLLFLSDTHI